MTDLCLITNFTTLTVNTLVGDKNVQALFRGAVISRALKEPYLMRGILAVSAIHLSHFRPKQREHFLSVAATHHQAATQLVIPLLNQVTAQSRDNLYLFTTFTLFFGVYNRQFAIISPLSTPRCARPANSSVTVQLSALFSTTMAHRSWNHLPSLSGCFFPRESVRLSNPWT